MPSIDTPTEPRNGTPAPSAPASLLTQPVGSATTRESSGTGEGLDRRRPRRLVTTRRVAVVLAALAVIALAVWAVWGRADGQTLRVASDRLTVATVEDGPFQEFVAVTGTVHPLRTVVLDAVEGGQVVRRHVEEGDTVAAGQLLFTLRNDDLAMDVMRSESQLEEQAAALRQNQLQMDQAALDLEQQVAQLDYDITRLERDEARLAGLVARGAAPEKDLLAARDELAYSRRRRELTARGADQQQAQRRVQTRDMRSSVGRLRENLSLVRRSSSNLAVRSPTAGQISAIDAEVGELKSQGERLGQIDVLDEVKVRALIDEHYLSRVAPGQRASATVGDQAYGLVVRTVYPEVTAGRFEAELVFRGAAPDARRGQSVRLRLELGDPEDARLLPRGGFYADTGGRWVYVVSADGRSATRRDVELGRQTPRQFEVLAGLERGERVITSSYAALGDADRLTIE